MRKLRTSDLFALGRCISKVNVKEDLKKIGMEASSVKDIYDNGFEIIFALFAKVCAEKSEQPIYEFLAGPFECKWEEVRDMELTEMVEKLREVADWNQWKGFFKTAARLT